MTHTIHTHQHRVDRKHNVLLLFIPGLIFTIVIGVYLILRIETNNPVAADIVSVEVETPKGAALDNDSL